MPSPFTWFDLSVSDDDDVETFYTDLLGWTTAPGAGGYRSWMVDGDQPWAGVTTGAAQGGGGWTPYVVVEDLDAATRRAVELGATVIRPATTGPGGTSVEITDPGGARLALYVPARQ